MITKGARILVIDDEIEIRGLLKVALSGHGFEVKGAATGRDGLDEITAFKPELVILDLGLPDLNGLEVLKNLREWSGIPVIILSVKGQENDKIAALDAGADDYVTKPFGMGELLARIRAALRHAAGTEDEPVLVFDDLTIDFARRYVTVNNRKIRLTPTEYELLKNLALNAGKVLTHKHLIRAVWKMTYEYDTHSLRVYIGQLRRKIEADSSYPRHIITEPGVGYRLL
ncbi:MAG TPA: DNA-binding response regulator [Desulfotomaculum sp.]|nr:MAG: response regulator [Desulfotomaculum sp. 46_80]HAG10503.1 DNA-binding response regulator [Desulfotomaculum sp.]HBY04074.1 DNA-binding response regulator [Desulfotomaculum sp.]